MNSEPYEIDLNTVPPNKETGLLVDVDELNQLAASLSPPADTVSDRTIWQKHITSDGYQAVNLRQLVWNIKDQTGPSCTSNQTTSAVELVREKAGYERISLSAASVFSFVGGRGGSSVQDNLNRITKVGCVPETMWPSSQIYGRAPAGFEVEAAKYRMAEPLWVPNFDQATWQLLCGHPIGFGVQWGSGGHSILAIRVRYDRSRNRWGWEIQNSWGRDWGDGGYGVLWEPQISSGISRRYGAVAWRYATHASAG